MGLFWITTYALLTYRAQLLVGFDVSLLTARRVLTTLAGTGLFWLALEDLIGRTGRRVNPLVVIFAVVPAAIVMLAIRIVLDQFLNVPSLPLYEHISWVLLWSGYFGLWVSGVLAWKLYREETRHVVVATPAVPADVVIQVARRPVAASAEWDWLIDAIVTEAAARGPGAKAELIDILVAKSGYELADAADPQAAAHNARVQLMRQIAKKLAESSSQ